MAGAGVSQTTDIVSGPRASAGFQSFANALAASVRRHRFIHALALATLVLGILVGMLTGNQPDVGIVGEYGFYIACALWIGGSAGATLYVVWLAAFARDPAPLRTFFRGILRSFSNAERWANGLNGIFAFVVFAAGFSVLKGAITYFAPFSWDRWLADTGQWLHFGRHPYELLDWLVESPLAIAIVNFLYNLWFVVVLGTTFSVCITERDTRLRHTYLLSFMLLWLVGGFFIAMGFSSAGPCYYARLDLGDRYQPLMDALERANQLYSISALSTQDMLWSGYKGLRNGNLGISAFPSLHVGTAVLIAMYATARSRIVGVAAWAFALAIAIGSVALGWHYALDAYGGGLVAVAAWCAVRATVHRWTPRALAAR